MTIYFIDDVINLVYISNNIYVLYTFYIYIIYIYHYYYYFKFNNRLNNTMITVRMEN